MSEGISRRNFFTGVAALGAVAALERVTLKEAFAGDRVVGDSFRGKVDTVKAAYRKETGFKDKALERVSFKGRETTRYDIIKNTIDTYKPKVMQDSEWQILKKYLPGVPGAESRFDTTRISSKNAVGYWQLTQIAIDDLNKANKAAKKPNLTLNSVKNIEDSTRAALEYMDTVLYMRVVEAVHITGDELELSQKERDTLIALLIINAYNAGQTRIAGLFAEYAQILDKDAQVFKKILSKNNHKAELLFDIFTDISLKNGYGRDASSYVFRVIAAAEVLAESVHKDQYLAQR